MKRYRHLYRNASWARAVTLLVSPPGPAVTEGRLGGTGGAGKLAERDRQKIKDTLTEVNRNNK